MYYWAAHLFGGAQNNCFAVRLHCSTAPPEPGSHIAVTLYLHLMELYAPSIYTDTSILENHTFIPGVNDIVFSARRQKGIVYWEKFCLI